jgi:hypothetical protein
MNAINPDPTMKSDRKAETMFGGAALNTGAARARVLATLLAALVGCLFWAPAARAEFSVQTAEAKLTALDGTRATQAGSHPDLTTTFAFGTKEGLFFPAPEGSVHEITVNLPAGLVGNATAVPRCPQEEFVEGGTATIGLVCPPATQVGIVQAKGLGIGVVVDQQIPIYNLVPGPGVPAELGFNFNGLDYKIRTQVRPDGGLTSTIIPSNTSAIYESTVTLWGVPGAAIHDAQRDQYCDVTHGECHGGNVGGTGTTPFLTLPSDCTDAHPAITMDIDSWEHIGAFTHVVEPVGPWTGCGKLAFEPKLQATPESGQAGAPSGYNFRLDVPQDEGAEGLGTPALRSSRVLLPEGLALSPSSADGLGTCSDAQLGLGSVEPPSCPTASTVGSVEVDTPLLPDPLSGEIYLRPQTAQDLARIALVIHGSGVMLKVPGVVHPDPQTGRLVATFEDAPPQPFSSMTLHFPGGPRAALVNPPTCGQKPVHTDFASWGGQAPAWDSGFSIEGNCGASSQFTPSLEAGTSSPAGGAPSPFILRVVRPDGQDNLSRIEATLPAGLLAKLKGVAVCGDAQAASGDCPAASQVGSTTVGAGAGSAPIYVPQPGRPATAVYLAGPYKGAPYSLVVKVPAQAGPFDLGTVTVRNGLYVDPTTTQVTAKSDPLPQILQGIPISYRDVRVEIDRPDFTINPTSCEAMKVTSILTSAGGRTATPSTPFQATDCEALGFKPSLALRFKGQTKRTGNPAVTATLKAPEGEANIAKTTVILPKSSFIDQSHVNNPCTRVQFNANACPAKSILGHAVAYTPLLDRPLEGPVYFRSNGGERQLPDLVADLDGQIHVTLVGFIDSVKVGKEGSRVRTRFLSVPDAPVSKFVLKLKGGKRGLIENSQNLCKTRPKARVQMTGQNGKVHDFRQKISTRCKKATHEKHAKHKKAG